MNWAAMRPALLSAVQAATGIDAKSVVWKDAREAAGWSKNGVVAKCSISGIKTIGCDEERRASYDAGTNTRTITLCGVRQFSFTVRIETQDGSDSGVVDILADHLRTRIWRDSILTSLRALDMAIADVKDTQKLDVMLQGRALSVAVIEFVMNGVENDVDDSPGAADWIAEVSGTGTLTDTDGTETTLPFDTKRATP